MHSSSKGSLNKKPICTSAVRSWNSCTIMKMCWKEFIAICLYFPNQLNQTPQIHSNMRKIFKLFVLRPFSTRNSQCHCFYWYWMPINSSEFICAQPLCYVSIYATSNPHHQHNAKKAHIKSDNITNILKVFKETWQKIPKETLFLSVRVQPYSFCNCWIG